MYDEFFNRFCERKYELYVVAAQYMGASTILDFWCFRSENIEWLEAEYSMSEDKVLH
jgi:hypothetical protein